MGLSDDLESEVKTIIGPQWSIRDGRKIPSTDDIALGNEGVRMELVVLYADIAGSTRLVRAKKDWFVAELAKAFLVCCIRIIRGHGGLVTSFDGDRVMSVFDGGSMNSNAARTALKINYAVTKIITPRIRERYSDQSGFTLGHCTGVARSKVLVTRSGIRNNNDPVWIGRAPNYAAKLSEQRDGPASYITKDVYDMLNDEAKYGGDPKQVMWTEKTVQIAGQSTTCYCSTWRMKP